MSRLSIILAIVTLYAAPTLRAQDDEISLGDLARAARHAKPADAEPQVIDNDNLPAMMDKAEAERLNGKPVFSIDSSGKTFRMTSPDGTCSLSFDARSAALISTPYVSSDLPQYQLARLDAEADIRDGVLEVTLHNRTDWELKEIVVGVTLLNQTQSALQPARLITATELQPGTKPPDLTTLYHLKATAPADATTVFRADVSDELGESKDWHWALVAARGIPPAAPPSLPSFGAASMLPPPTSGAQTSTPAQPSVTSAQVPATAPTPSAATQSMTTSPAVPPVSTPANSAAHKPAPSPVYGPLPAPQR